MVSSSRTSIFFFSSVVCHSRKRLGFAGKSGRVTHNDALGRCNPDQLDDSSRQADAKIT